MSQGSDIRAFMARASREQVGTVTRGLGLRVLAGVVLRTPVDTGRARGNWQTAIGPGKTGEVNTEDKGGASTINEGSATIARQRDFQPITLTNNVPYINKLDEGSSKQAPEGMVDLTLAGLGLAPGREG